MLQKNSEDESMRDQQQRHHESRDEVGGSQLPRQQPAGIALAEAAHAPAVAQALDSIGRETSRAALRKIMTQALASGLLKGRAAELAEQFSGLLWGNLMVSLLLGVAERPAQREIAGRAREAAAAFLRLHPPPDDAATAA
jgi:hypothetical protein